MMNIESRLNRLEDICFKDYQDILVDGYTIQVKNSELMELLAEVIAARREERRPKHRLIDKGILSGDRGQAGLLDLILTLNQGDDY